MKTILLWDPRFPVRNPVRLTLADDIASACVRAGVAAAADPADAGALGAGAAISNANLVEIALQHGPRLAGLTRVFLPLAVAQLVVAAGTGAAIGAPIAAAAPYPGPIANRTFMPNVATTNRYIQSETRHILRDIPSDGKIQLVYPAAYIDVNSAGVETPSTSARTFTAGISTDPTFATNVVAVTFSGVNNGSQPAGTLLVSDAVQLPAGAAIGSPIYIRTWADRGASAGTHPYLTQTGIIDSANGEACNVAASTIADVTKGGGAVTNSHPNVWFGPVAIVGLTAKETVAIFGDSRGFGAQAGNSAGGGLSPIQRALDVAGIAWTCLSVSSDRVAWAASNNQPNRIAACAYASRVAAMFGTNDITNGRTAAQFAADLDTLKGKVVSKKFKVATIGVFGLSSSDSFATVGGQSFTAGASANDAVRIAANQLIRQRSDYFENADFIETAREGGRYKATGGAWTGDGTHENNLAANTVAAQAAYSAGILAG